MLQEILTEIEAADHAISIPTLAKKMRVEESALRGMINFLVRKGRLSPHQTEQSSLPVECDGFVCRCCPAGNTCPVGAKTIPFMGR